VPITAAVRKDAEHVADQLRRIAKQIDKLAENAGGNNAHPELVQIGNRLARIGDALEKGVGAGRVNAAQLRSIANNFAGIGASLLKGLER
jgi:uncharacterized protein YukE